MRVSRIAVLVIAILVGTSPRLLVHEARADEELVNDQCADAISIDTIPFTSDIEVGDATHDATDPVSSCEVDPDSPSVWYRLDVPGGPDVTRQVVLSTLESSYGAVLTVFTGACDALTEVACGGIGVGDLERSRLAFTATGGTSYRIMVTSTHGVSPADELFLTVDVYDAFPGGKEAKKVVACQDAVTGAGASFMAGAFNATAKCVNGLFKCVQTAAGDPSCAPKACAQCEHAIATGFGRREAITAGVIKKCGQDRVPFSHVIGSAAGLGFEALSEACEEASHALASIDAVGACVADGHVCAAAHAFGVLAPRARELVVDLCGAAPAELDCLPGDTTGGAVAVDEAKAVTKCAAGIAKAGTKFVLSRVKAVQRCTDRVFTCLQTKPLGDPCALDVETACTKDLAAIGVAHNKLLVALDAKCGGVPFDVLLGANGLGLKNVADSCDSVGAPLTSLAGYGECVARRGSCEADGLILTERPLADTFLRIADQPRLFAFCN